jgi:hypothetical protein
MLPVENHPYLMKTETGLVVNVDKSGYTRHMNQKKTSVKMDAIESEIAELKQDMGEIKNLLQTLINNSK